MGNPIQVPNLGTPVIQPRPSSLNLGQLLPLILQQLQQSRENKMEEARGALSNLPEGATYASLTPEQQVAYQRATGRRTIGPDEILKPVPGSEVFSRAREQATSALANVPEGTTYHYLSPEQQVAFQRLTGRTRIADTEVVRPESGVNAAFSRVAPVGSPLRAILDATYAQSQATGGTVKPTTPEGITAEASATVARARVSAAEADDMVSGVALVQAGHPEQMSTAQLAVYQAAHNFIPSDIITQNMSNAMKQSVIQEGARILADPNMGGFGELLAQYGTHRDEATGRQVPNVTLGSLVGAVALNIGTQIDQAMGLRNIQINNAGQARNVALEAMYRTASAVSTAMGGKYSPDMVAAVMQGDRRIMATRQGQAVQAILNASYTAAMVDLATKGDYAARTFTANLELLKNPQISSDPRTAASIVEANRQISANALANTALGMRPIDPAADAPTATVREARDGQQQWDAFRNGALSHMAFFTTQYGAGTLGFGQRLVAQPPAATAPQIRSAETPEQGRARNLREANQTIMMSVPGLPPNMRTQTPTTPVPEQP
jgi:hypothetical protein